MGPRSARAAWPLVVLALLAGCSESTPSADSDEPDSSATTTTDTATTPEPSETEQPTQDSTQDPTQQPAPAADDALPPVHHRVSLPALMRERPTPTRIRRGAVLGTADVYTRYAVTYRSGDLTISGVMLVPDGKGPFPGVVLNHGYIDPSYYVTGQGLAREQDWLARAGFVVLHTDYRGHAGSDPSPPLEREARLGYVRDAINAVRALRREPYVDAERMAMLGRSMGGGVTLQALVVAPGLVDAAVVYASVSSRYLDNLRHFTVPNRPESVRALYDRFGTPRQEPRFYRELSARPFFDRITEPVLMHHGTNDESCPVRWAHATYGALERAGVDARLEIYPGEMHAFVPRWQDSIIETVKFLRRRLDG